MFFSTIVAIVLAASTSTLAAPLPGPQLIIPASSSSLQITSPAQIHQCHPATFSWTPTTAPYLLTVLDSHIPTDDATFAPDSELLLPIHSASTATWVVDMLAGRNVTILIRDATGEVARSHPRVIGRGHDRCLD